ETLGEILGSSYSVQPSTHQNSTQTNNATTGVNATLDFTALLQASQVLSSSIEFDDLIHQLTTLILQQSGADQCTLVMPDLSEKWRVQVITTAEKSSLGTEALKNNPNMPVKLIQYVKNTKNTVIINNLKTDLPVIDDYLREQHPKSILCLPLLNKGKVIGVLSLRHQSISDVFTEERLLPLNFLCSQAAISLENSRLYQMEQEKTKQLQRSEANLRSLYENAADPILILDEKTFLDCNQAAVELFKATDTSQLCGVHPADISPEFQADGQSSFEKAQAMIQQASQAGKHRFEWQHQTLTGEVFWAEVVLTPLRYKGVMVLHSIVRDISDRKAAEAKALEKSQELEQALIQLQQSQSQVVQSEKMSALGNLVAGVAHEINNPIGFLNGSIKNAQNYVQDLQEHLDLYQTHYPNATEPILENAEEIDLEFVCEDLPKLLTSMKGATDRIKAISTSLRTFSRADTEHKVSANLIEGLDSTLLILKYRLKADENRPAIQVVKEYGDLPSIDCFPGRLNQVFMNLLANAIDVFDEAAQQTTFSDLKDKPQIITVKTTLLTEAANGTKAIEIRIQDNGKGMPAEVKERIFDHLFTTKGVGKGTGLGLAIAKEIIVDAHGGTIAVQSEPGQGTEFCICLPM
ncbi:MAG: ATP-binding protein, partial [Cyanobacteria bacterium P01_F01_bin.53]